MSRQDDIAARAVRKSTLKSLKEKKEARLHQLKNDYEKAVQEVNIQYAEDPERLKAKYAAEEYAKNEHRRRRAAKHIALEKKNIEFEKKSRPLTTGEEITSSVIQGLGACLFIAGTAVLETIAIGRIHDYVNTTTVFYALFGASMIVMYVFSLLQHALTNATAKRVFNRLAHIWTFLIIGFCYSVYTITKMENVAGWVLFGIVWALVLTGILFYAIAGKKFENLNTILYIVAGFSGLLVARTLYHVLSAKCFTMLIIAAVFYVVGIVFYNFRKIKYMHTIGNVIMLVGSVYIFLSMFYI